MRENLALTSVPIDAALARRWSPRAFDINKPVEEDRIVALCEAARWACSSNNDQPWRFIYWNKYVSPESFERAFNCIDEWNRNWVKNAPILFASIAGSKFHNNGRPNRWGNYDTGAAAINLCTQAYAMGLAAHEMGGFSIDKLRKEFGIPIEYTPMAMIAVGYLTDPEILDGEYYDDEIKARTRRPLGMNFFKNNWEEPII